MKNTSFTYIIVFLLAAIVLSTKGQTYNEVPWSLQTDSLSNLINPKEHLHYWIYKVEPERKIITQIDDGFYSFRGMGPHYRDQFFIRHNGKMYVYDQYGIDNSFRFFSDFMERSGIEDSLSIIYYGYMVTYMFYYYEYDWYQDMAEMGISELWPLLINTSDEILYYCFYVLSHCRPNINSLFKSIISIDNLSEMFSTIADKIEDHILLEDGSCSYDNYLAFSLKLLDYFQNKYPICCDFLDYLDYNRLKQKILQKDKQIH